jgi:hypothetical protein
MRIEFGADRVEFRPWRVREGRVFDGLFAMDTETTAIDEERPWLTPAYVIGAAFDGRFGVFVPRDRVGEFLTAHDGIPVAMHNAAFDLDVLEVAAPSAGIYDRVDRNLVYDTQLMHRLLVLGTEGHTASNRGESTLEHCVWAYLNLALPKDIRDAHGRDVRLSYGQWLGRPASEIDEPYLRYLATDAVATFRVFQILKARLEGMLASADRVWGYVSPAWLAAQVGRWGWQTHRIQLRASIVLRAITANGLTLDSKARQTLADRLTAETERLRAGLAESGYLPGQPGSGRALQSILRQLEMNHPGVRFPRTPTGKHSTSLVALGEMAGEVPFLKTLFEHQEVEKLLSCFVGKMSRPIIHASFNVLARTGRTTSFGELNAQNLPRNDAVRGCFVPSAGHVFIKADYATIEMVTLAQALQSQFGHRSKMAAAINAGKDLHRLVAAQVTGKPEAAVTDEDRQKAKPINFGKPGAMGNATLRQYAQASYGVQLSDDDVQALSTAWLELFPEMEAYLRPDVDAADEVARLFNLTPIAHFEHTGCRKFLDHPENAGRADRPHPILGGMLLKVLRHPDPITRDGRPYFPADVDFLWTRLDDRLDLLPAGLHGQVRGREPSPTLFEAVRALAGRAPVFTLTGRLRAQASFAARRNTVFQGLASDGAKLALWKLWRAGYRIVNFVHDEVLIEIPAGEDLRAKAEHIRRLMIAGMAEVVPDVHVGVEIAACERWYKKAKPIDTPDGGLGLWRPAGLTASAAQSPTSG